MGKGPAPWNSGPYAENDLVAREIAKTAKPPNFQYAMVWRFGGLFTLRGLQHNPVRAIR